MYKTITTDFLVIGSGIAGLSFALRASEFGDVIIITKKEDTESNTNYAQGGIAAVMGADDSLRLHREDTLNAGCELSDTEAVDILVNEGPARVRELMEIGVRFSREHDEDGLFRLALAREGGHSKRRIVHAADHTGNEIERALVSAVLARERVRLFENYLGVDQLIADQPGKRKKRCIGIFAYDRDHGGKIVILARATKLATGGAGQIYRHTTNPRIATGDGMAMAYRAGAVMRDMEFVQFHPTSLYHPEGNSFLISEAVRGEGAILRLKDGSPFMNRYHSSAELAPRDTVARAIDSELIKSGEQCVYLDLTHLSADLIRRRFPNIYRRCRNLDIDIMREMIPVVPAAHYFCGGVKTNLHGRTSIEGLFASGETACTGVHGANRLASNSLLEAVVFASRAVRDARKCLDFDEVDVGAVMKNYHFQHFENETRENILIQQDIREVQNIMWDFVGIVRSDARLIRALKRLRLVEEEINEYHLEHACTPDSIELRNIVNVALLVTEFAYRRKESRGLHYSTDYPHKDNKHWKKSTRLNRKSDLPD